MTFALAPQFYVFLLWGHNSVLNVKAVVAAFNQEKALVGAFSVIVQLHRLIVYSTSYRCCCPQCLCLCPPISWISAATTTSRHQLPALDHTTIFIKITKSLFIANLYGQKIFSYLEIIQ